MNCNTQNAKIESITEIALIVGIDEEMDDNNLNKNMMGKNCWETIEFLTVNSKS